MADEQKQHIIEEDKTGSSSEEDTHTEISLNESTDSVSKNFDQENPDPIASSPEILRNCVAADCEVEEIDVLIIEELPVEQCPEQSSDERLETKISYEYPSDLDDESCVHLPQTYFDNRKNLLAPQSPEVLNISELFADASPKSVSRVQRYAEVTDSPSCSSHKKDENLFEVTYIGPKIKHASRGSDDLKQITKCPDYNSDEFADVEDNVSYSSSSDNCETMSENATKSKNIQLENAFLLKDLSQAGMFNEGEKVAKSDIKHSITPKNGLVRSKISKSKSDERILANNIPSKSNHLKTLLPTAKVPEGENMSTIAEEPEPELERNRNENLWKSEINIFEPSCSNYVPPSKSNHLETLLPTVNVPEGKNMAAVPEEPELKNSRNKKRGKTEPVVSKTNSLKAKSIVGNRKDKCNVCNVRLGLCAIKCRCGGYFCAKHRYDKEHNCPFDYRTMGAEEIRKNNPKIVAEKIRKL